MGPGALGGRYGHLLYRAGEEVNLIARGAHLAAMQERGLTLRDGDSEVTEMIPATDDPAAIGTVDLILFCVKTYDLESAAEQIRPLVGDSTALLPIQNGVTSGERIAAIVGEGCVLSGATYSDGHVVEPGVVTYGGVKADLMFGELDGGDSDRTVRIKEIFDNADLLCDLRADMQRIQWEKFVAVCGTAGVLGLLRLPLGPVIACEESCALFLGVMKEIEVLARASGTDVEEGYAEQRLDHFSKAPFATRSSLLVDLTRGRRLELESLNGTAVSLGKEAGVPTPLNSVCYDGLKPFVDGPLDIPE